MNAHTGYFSSWGKAVQRNRDQHGGLQHLSDWQVYCAGLVSSTVSCVALGLYNGPIYIPMPTGSGKTTGAIWGMVKVLDDFPDERICFLTPYKESVDRVYAELSERLGADCVGRYHSDAAVDKEAELAKQIVVLTHQFVPANKGRLDDRTLFIVDEAVFETGTARLRLSQFAAAREWATTNDVYPQEFRQLFDLLHSMDAQIHDVRQKYVAVPAGGGLSFAEVLAAKLHLPDHAQTIEDMELLSAVQLFCEALLHGTVSAGRNLPKSAG